MAENPSQYLSKKSRPDSDHKLEEPSHMKSDAIDAFLGHWLKLQKKGSRPLVLKDPADKSSEPNLKPKTLSKRKGKGKGKAWYIESDDSDNQDVEDKSDNAGTDMERPRPESATPRAGEGEEEARFVGESIDSGVRVHRDATELG